MAARSTYNRICQSYKNNSFYPFQNKSISQKKLFCLFTRCFFPFCCNNSPSLSFSQWNASLTFSELTLYYLRSSLKHFIPQQRQLQVSETICINVRRAWNIYFSRFWQNLVLFDVKKLADYSQRQKISIPKALEIWRLLKASKNDQYIIGWFELKSLQFFGPIFSRRNWNSPKKPMKSPVIEICHKFY